MELNIEELLSDKWYIKEKIDSVGLEKMFVVQGATGENNTQYILRVYHCTLDDICRQKNIVNISERKNVLMELQRMMKRAEQNLQRIQRLNSCKYIVKMKEYKILPHEDKKGFDILIWQEKYTSLKEYLRLHTLIDDETKQLGIDMCEALAACEKENIVHGYVMPENIFLDEGGSWRLGNFPILEDSVLYEIGWKSETESLQLQYTAPEAYLRLPEIKTRDVYSVGMVLYQCRNENKLPFSDNIPELSEARLLPFEMNLLRIQGIEIPEPKCADKQLCSIILKAIQFEPENRYQSAYEMKSALESKVKMESVEEIEKKGKKSTETVKSVESLKGTESPGDSKHRVVAIWGAALLCICGLVAFFLIKYPPAFMKKADKSQSEDDKTIQEVVTVKSYDSLLDETAADGTDDMQRYLRARWESTYGNVLANLSNEEMDYRTADLEQIATYLTGKGFLLEDNQGEWKSSFNMSNNWIHAVCVLGIPSDITDISVEAFDVQKGESPIEYGKQNRVPYLEIYISDDGIQRHMKFFSSYFGYKLDQSQEGIVKAVPHRKGTALGYGEENMLTNLGIDSEMEEWARTARKWIKVHDIHWSCLEDHEPVYFERIEDLYQKSIKIEGEGGSCEILFDNGNLKGYAVTVMK